MAHRRENSWARCAASRPSHCAILAGVGTGAFKVLQFNIQFGQSWDEADPDNAPINLDLTITEIRSHEADIVLLQEVEQGWRGAQLEPPPTTRG